MATIKGGDQMMAALAAIALKLKKAGTVKVGFLAGSTAPNGDSIPMRAVYNEFGTKNAPPRPFFRNMVKEKSPEWPAAIAAQLKATHYDTALTLQRVGEGVKGQLQESILDLSSPPLAQSTIDRKGHSKPLVDSGDMLNAVDYEVKTN